MWGRGGGVLIDAGTREVFSRLDVLEEAAIEPHLLTQACNDMRKGGAGCSGAADCGGAGAVCGVWGSEDLFFLPRWRWCEDWGYTITVSKRSPHTTHTTGHTPHPNPRPRPLPAVHSSAARTYYSPAPSYRPTPVRGLILPASAIIPFICALILIFSSTSSMLPHSLSRARGRSWRLLPYCP